MICGKRTKKLTPDGILELISSFDIFKYYMPDNSWKINQATNSPLRKDKNPSWLIGNKNGILHFNDFATGQRGDCFEFVKQLFHMSTINEVLHKIDQDFNLGISSGEIGDYKKIVNQYHQPEELGKRYCLIQVVTRKFTNSELKFWGEYHQSLEDLRANNIYSIKSLYLNKSKFALKDEELRFGYLYEGGWWKLYFPEREKKHKWLSNVPLVTVYGLNNLMSSKNAIITKSLKDYLVCKKVYENVAHVQNESIAAFSKETVEYINNNSKEVFLGFDSDVAGKAASFLITKAFGWKHINTPDRLLPQINDFAGWAKLEGLDVIREHFIKKGLINEY
jgi:hypothetical protein